LDADFRGNYLSFLNFSELLLYQGKNPPLEPATVGYGQGISPENARLLAMYEDFHVTDHWTREDLHCRWTANVVAIATRHADAVDIRFEVNGRPVWIALPADAWVVQKERSGHVITDRLAAQVAGRYLKQAAESGYDNGREMYTMSVAEVLEQVAAVMEEVGHSTLLPELPVMPRS
jgi:hypothetical protein